MTFNEGGGGGIHSCTLQDELLLRYIWSSEQQKIIVQACHIDPTAGHMGKVEQYIE